MKTLRWWPALALVAILVLLPAAYVCAQQPSNTAAADAAAPEKAAPAGNVAPTNASPVPEKVTLDVRGLDIDNLLQFFSRTYGLTIIKDPGLTGPVTIMCPQPVLRQEAFDTLNSVLGVRGFTAVVNGNVMKIMPLAKAVQSNVELAVGRSPSQAGDQVITQLVPVKSADAVQLQTDLTPLVTTGGSIIANGASNTLTITDYASNITRLLQIIEQLDTANASQVRVFPLVYAQASDVAQLLTQMYFTQPRAGAGAGAQVPGFIQRLRGGQVAAALAGRNTASAAPVGQAVADARTNSVVVSTSRERLDGIAEVIKGLDRPIARQGNLTVIPLQRANAQEVANALTAALGGRATSTGTTTTTTYRPTTGSSTGFPTLGSGISGGTGLGTSTGGRAEPAGGTPAGAVVAPSGPALGAVPVIPGATGASGPQSANVLQLGGAATVVAEPNTNSLIITGTPEQAALVRQLIEQLDQAPPQVLIEAIVAEVALDAERKLGFEWDWTSPAHLSGKHFSGTASTNFDLAAETTGLSYVLTRTNLTAMIKALASDDTATILSTPRIFTSNNRPAVINIVTQTPYISGLAVSTGIAQTSVDYLNVGIILQVTPQISPDGTVSMQVSQQASELLGFRNLGNGITAPTVAGRSAQATIRVADGQTVILGGIISDNVSRSVDRVPILGDLPLIGALFRHSTVSKKKSELLVFLTPRVVRTPEEAVALTRSEQAKSLAPMHLAPAPTAKP